MLVERHAPAQKDSTDGYQIKTSSTRLERFLNIPVTYLCYYMITTSHPSFRDVKKYGAFTHLGSRVGFGSTETS